MKEPVMKINSLYNILSTFSVSYKLRFMVFVSALLFLGFNGYGQTVTFSSATGFGAENAGTGLPTLLVDGNVTLASSVTLTPGGTAIGGGTDYTLASTVINIPIGNYTNTPFSLGITIIDDAVVEPDETIVLGLGTPTGDVIVTAPTSTTYTINNDDSVTVSFSSATGSGPENTGANLPTLFVTGTVTAATTVTVTNSGTGTATSGVDYTFTSPQVVNIPAGVYDGTTATDIPIPTLSITNDAGVEPNETIVLGLSAATGDASLVAPTSTTYTINNDD
ncbi:hypothetical protein DHD32_19105, partial [Arenibacter sp. TNZ]|uniref:Calx-beta domain-containing protein n=1 Tax=Arenibacter TaxID=178469 RepID=UPI001964A767